MALKFLREKQKLVTHTLLTSPPMALYAATGQALWCERALDAPWLASTLCSDHHQATYHHCWQLVYLWKGMWLLHCAAGAAMHCYQHALLLSQLWRWGLASSMWLAGLNPDSKKTSSLTVCLLFWFILKLVWQPIFTKYTIDHISYFKGLCNCSQFLVSIWWRG